MRVAVNGWFWGRPETGSGQYVRRVTEALANLDPTLKLVVCLPSESAHGGEGLTAPPNLLFEILPTPSWALAKVWWEQVTVPRFARRQHADLLHVPYWAPPAVSKVPTAVTIHDIIPLILPAYRGHAGVRLYTALVQATTPHARLVITDSEASRHDILDHMALPAARVRAIPLALDATYMPLPASDDEAILSHYALPAPYILYLGGYDVRKNLRTVMEAFAIAHRANPDLLLAVAGRLPQEDTPFTPDPRRLAADSGLPPEATRFLGFVPEAHKPALYRGAQAVLYPSRYEGFGYPCLEALACGTPVVGSDRSSLPEVVGNAGVLLPPDDAEGMAGALLQLCCDDAFREQVQAAAIAQSRRFSWQRTARETLAAFEDVLR